MVIAEVEALLKDVRNWHKVRAYLDNRPGRKPLQMDTLSRVIEALEAYKQLLERRLEVWNEE